jgi:5-methylthioadenosine/S-adenosylhomocysteine deaminase
MRLCCALQKILKSNPQAYVAHQALYLGTQGGANALNLGNQIGSLTVGKKADIILLDKSDWAFIPYHDLFIQTVYSGTGYCVDTVIVNGKVLMKGRKVLSVDEEKIVENANEKGKDIAVCMLRIK